MSENGDNMHVRGFMSAALATAVAAALAAAVVTPSGPAAAGEDRAAQGANSEDKRVRADFGLSTDEEHIRALRADEARGDGRDVDNSFGVPMRSFEVAEIRTRERVAADDAPTIRRYFAAVDPEAFGGVFIDNSTGELTVLVVADRDRHASALSRAVRHPDRLRTSAAAWSLRSLEHGVDVLAQQMDRFAADGVDISSIVLAEMTNRVVVTVTSDPDAAHARLSREVDGKILDVRAGGPAQLTGTPYRNSPPFRGGQRIVRQGVTNSDCTSGFIGYRNTVPTSYSVVTAGHCAQPNTCWSQGPQNDNTYIGCTQATTWPTGPSPGRAADAARVNIDTSSYRSNDYVASCCPESYRDVLAWADTNETLGTPACNYGYVTIASCGTLQSKVGVLSGYEDGTGVYYRFYNLRTATYANTFGDSGGSITNGGGLAMGLQTGFVGSLSYYTNISLAMSAVGVHGLLIS